MLPQQAYQNKYLETSVQTATPAQLLILLIDGAIRFCRIGIEGMKKEDYRISHLNLCKVQNIINEFMSSLDQKAPIAEELLQLYEYFNQRLAEANLKKRPEPAEEVLGYLVELKSTWVEAAKLSSQPGATKHG